MNTTEQRAERLVSHNILCCMSAIVNTLAKSANGAIHNGRGTNPYLDESIAETMRLCDQAFELACPVDDWEEAARQNGAAYSEIRGWFVGSVPETFKSAQELCEALSLDPYAWEVYEHWAVSDYLADLLIEAGEKVDKDFAGLCVWARTTTGQMIAADSAIHRVLEIIDKRIAG